MQKVSLNTLCSIDIFNEVQLKFKNNFIGYFQFYYRVTGNKLLVSIFLSVTVAILDGLGLSMVMPLLQSVSGPEVNVKSSVGRLHILVDTIIKIGLPLTLITVLGVLVILFSLKGIAKFIELNYQAKVIQYFMKEIRHDLVNGLQKLSYRGFITLDAGRIQNTCIAEVQKMSMAITFYLGYIQCLCMLTAYVYLSLLANYQFAILVIISAGLANLLYTRINKAIKKTSFEISKKGHDFNSYMIQAIHYFKYLKSTNCLSNYSSKLAQVIDKTENLNRKISYYDAITTGIKEPIILLIVVAVIYTQITWLNGNLGSMILGLLLFYRAIAFLLRSQQFWQAFIQNSGAMRTVAELSKSMDEHMEVQGLADFKTIENRIVLENIDISYGDNKVLNDVNIVIPKNNTIALIGVTGAGKTTLANVIMGLIKPDHGKILIDAIPLSEYNLYNYRNKIGYSSQDSVIFNDNVFNNITFWAEQTPENEKRFWQVVKLASLKEFVESQSQKEKTILGDDGILISGGQKQRISIARELYKNIEVLILDEATSSLDSETEQIIQENIENLHGHYTIIVIAHRLSTIRNVDTIYLLDKGKVHTSGNFDSMLQNSNTFKHLAALQGL